MHKVLVLARAFSLQGEEALQYFREQGYEVIMNPLGEFNLSEEKLIPLVEDVEAIVAGEDWITVAVIHAAKNLIIISKVGIGLDRVDIPAATKRGIPVTNTPAANYQSVADLTFGLLISLARRIPESSGFLLSGTWKPLIGTELWNKTIGIIGLGRIGKAVAKRARGFDMNILAYDLYQDHEFAIENDINYVAFDELLKNADFITIHVPGLKETKYLIGAREFGLMKSSVFIVNTARGGIVDEKALYIALKNGNIRGAGLDVYEKEPAMGNPLLELPNVVATPHMSSYSRESLARMCMSAAKNVITIINGKTPESLINPEIYQH
ncbi:MAG: phosphoglycerate dehydrogenase [FCB group bacterium]|nr:phosphoglycerate dehydrogenase [FCB group bacterium]